MNKDQKVLDIALLMSYYILAGDANVLAHLRKVQRMSKYATFEKQFEEIIDWVNSKGFEVSLETDAEDRVEWADKTIYINSRNHVENRYYTLLHECGHMMIAQSWRDFDRDHPMYACSSDGRNARSKAYKVSTVAEELEAWKRGRRLARRLQHHVNEENYDAHVTKNVMSYIEWAAGVL